MIVYFYDSETGEYRGSGNAQPNPLEGGFILPAFATKKAPPTTGQNQTCCFVDNDWVLVPDFRGQKQVEVATKLISIVDYIGIVKVGYQFISNEAAEDIINNPEKYKAINGVLVDISNTEEYLTLQLSTAKNAKLLLNENLRASKPDITVSLGKLKLKTPIGSLDVMMSGFINIVNITKQPLTEGAFRFQGVDGLKYSSPAMTPEEVASLYLEVFSQYNRIDKYSTFITERINAAQNIGELELIQIDYERMEGVSP